jgi:hypothetical protein
VKYTIAEALQEMRRLRGADAGRLRGWAARDLDQLGGLEAVAQPWGEHLAEQIDARRAGLIHATTPEYVVESDGLPIAWVTAHAAVVAPAMPMSRIQAKHQRQAVAVLSDLDRDALQALADERDRREGRSVVSEEDNYEAMVGALRVAPSHNPTSARWVRVGADLDKARQQLMQATGVGAAEQAIVLAAIGYGHHGHHAHRLALELICAMHAVTAAHSVSLNTVGNWIDHDYGLAGQVDPQALPDQFAAAYLGRYASHGAYVQHRMEEQGWTDILRAHAMEPYFDTRRYERHLFSHDVIAIDLDGWQPGRGIEVFRRPAA